MAPLAGARLNNHSIMIDRTIVLSGARCVLQLHTAIIPAEPDLWVFLTDTPIPDRVIQAAMMVEYTLMSACRSKDQNIDN